VIDSNANSYVSVKKVDSIGGSGNSLKSGKAHSSDSIFTGSRGAGASKYDADAGRRSCGGTFNWLKESSQVNSEVESSWEGDWQSMEVLAESNSASS
jgi:hypothetical protein